MVRGKKEFSEPNFFIINKKKWQEFLRGKIFVYISIKKIEGFYKVEKTGIIVKLCKDNVKVC